MVTIISSRELRISQARILAYIIIHQRARMDTHTETHRDIYPRDHLCVYCTRGDLWTTHRLRATNRLLCRPLFFPVTSTAEPNHSRRGHLDTSTPTGGRAGMGREFRLVPLLLPPRFINHLAELAVRPAPPAEVYRWRTGAPVAIRLASVVTGAVSPPAPAPASHGWF